MKDIIDQIVAFLSHIGLNLKEGDVPDDTFLPGICYLDQTLVYDREKLLFPGDLLHEAGHLALLSPQQRATANGDFAGDGGSEMAAIAWSYAACVYLSLPANIVFHADGYKGDAAWLVDTFSEGGYIGLPILEWKGLAHADGERAYPEMQHWLYAQ